MDLIVSDETRQVWFGRLAASQEFVSPASGEYALLLAIGDESISVDEQAARSEQFVRSGCRYAVCFGRVGSSWEDSIDMVGVMDEVDGRPSSFVLTTWHDNEPIEDTVEFFAEYTRFDDWTTEEYVVVVVGGSAQFEQDVRRAVCSRFSMENDTLSSRCRHRAWRWAKVVALAVALAIPTYGAVYCFGGYYARDRAMARAEQHILLIQPLLDAEHRFADVALGADYRGPGGLSVTGDLATSADFEVLREIVLSSKPPVLVRYHVMIESRLHNHVDGEFGGNP